MKNRVVVLLMGLAIAAIGVGIIFSRYDYGDVPYVPFGVNVDWGSHHVIVGIFFLALSGIAFWNFFKGA